MKNHLLALIIALLPILISAQDLEIKGETINPSKNINDGIVKVTVTGGVPPYTYKWSNQSTSLDSNESTGLTEGVPYTVVVTDANGATKSAKFTVKAEEITEIFNSTMTPAVSALGAVLFWDPFASIGVYDPIVYVEEEQIGVPDFTPEIDNKYVLSEWLQPEGTHVDIDTPIAVISDKKGVNTTVTAPAQGVLKHITAAGQTIYDSENQEDVITQGAHFFGKIAYDEPLVLTHANGDPMTKPIPFIVIWLVVGAIFFTIRMGFINFKGFKHAIDLGKGKYDDPNAPGQVTHFQALATAVSGTVGLGNIAGVAVAISLGGAGATFWIILAGFLGMSSKFVECTLGVKYREIAPDGRVFGGPMSYLRKGLEKRNKKTLGKILAGVFAILCVGASFGGGNMFQANQAFEVLSGQIPALEGYGFWFGLIVSVLVGAVIVGGIQSIAKVTEKVVPFMAVLYVLGCLVVIFANFSYVGTALSAIVNGAFNPAAIKGGVIGVLIIGFQRAAFSNEAGVGSAAIAHSVAKTNHPPSEGFVALLEPFIDTVVVCTLTALVLIFTGKHEVGGMGGAQLTSEAFGTVVTWFPYVLTAAIFLFAFSTMISWSYYGMRAWTYLFGKSRRTETVYKLFFLVFVIIGASVSLGAVLDFSDMMILSMSFPNIIGLYLMSGEVRRDLDDYVKKLKAGLLYQPKRPDKEN